MTRERLYLYDTTLRDGQQTQGVQFSVADKVQIAHALDRIGIDDIEGGWPGANPTDSDFFAARPQTRATFTAFGMTKRAGRSADNDDVLAAVLNAGTPAVCLVGQTHDLHVTTALGISLEENLDNIAASVAHIVAKGREALFDAEHFFDGYKANAPYALDCALAAYHAGARWIVLCDTNGGTLPAEIHDITRAVIEAGIPGTHLGIHTHNDTESAVAGSLAAIDAGARQVQGTLNGLGERCGNANLISAIANLQLKLDFSCVRPESLQGLKDLSGYVYELANVATRDEAAFVGNSAFAHKGGVHVSAVMKDPVLYEHIHPETVGNSRRVLVSDLSGRSNVVYKMAELGLETAASNEVKEVVQQVKELEHNGYYFEAAEASFELLVERRRNKVPTFFSLTGLRINVERDAENEPRSEASIRVSVDGHIEHTAAEGDGPVNALDNALRKALVRFFPDIALVKLVDYKVRVLAENGSGTASRVRVLIESQAGDERWSTMGVSENIIEASWQALVDSYTFFLYKKQHVEQPREEPHYAS